MKISTAVVTALLSAVALAARPAAAQESENQVEDTEDVAQDEATSTEGAPSTPSSPDEDKEAVSDPEGEDEEEELEDESLEEELEEDSGAQAEVEGPEDPAGLDMSALGDIDPAAELEGTGGLGEDEAAARAVEQWTERELDLLEIHGYFRVRPELYHKFNIRGDEALYNQTLSTQVRAGEDIQLGLDCRDGGSRKGCKNRTLAGANMRLRVEPTLNISEEVWVQAQIDFLDNVMLGSTPRYWQNFVPLQPSTIETGRLDGYDIGPPGSSDAVVVRRAWGEVLTPLGQLRFGRMGDHWGLGMLHNSGNGLEQDFGSTVDRLMFVTKINDWMIAPAFDFPGEGITGKDASGRPLDLGQLDDSYQLAGIIAYKHDAEEQAAMLRRGDWLINTGLYLTYRWQVLSYEVPTDPALAGTDAATEPVFYRRDMWALTPDFWFQLLYDTFHFELELAMIFGEIGNPDRNLENFDDANALSLLQVGGVLQVDYGLLSDQLRIGLEVGFASGDGDVEGLRAPANYDQLGRPDDDRYTAFAFNPAYNTDLILYHHILGSVSQSYYFNPWLRYDFFGKLDERKMWVQADVVYSRAVFGESTINNDSGNLGVELNAEFRYVSADRFHAGLKYGVLFPLKAFQGTPYSGLLDAEDEALFRADTKLDIPQTLQVVLGITY